MLADKKSEIEELTKKLAWYQEEVARLTSTNEALVENNNGLVKNNKSLTAAYKLSQANYKARLEAKTAALAELSKEHSDLQARYAQLEISSNASNILTREIQQKDAELALLRSQLQKAREEVRGLERKVMARQSNRYLDIKDPSHFSASTEALFQEAQRWCEEFSRASAGRRCNPVHRIPDETVKDRIESVMLDDRGVRRMLKDESRRHTVLTAILMRLILEFVFTRYLFGLDPEERQKLLQLESMLAEVGATTAVNQWRATTLTLLSQRSSFRSLLTSTTETTLAEMMTHLNHLLPPPPQHAPALISSLRTLLTHAVTLAIEMRTQRAEYVMRRPPIPIYDDHGEVSNTVFFSAEEMNAVNAASPSEALLSTVKCVLFPLVIRRGNEYGEEYEVEHVVFPMQVLVNRAHQLRSESRRSSLSSVAGSAAGWREEQISGKSVSRLTPITDHSPRTTPEKTRREAEPDLLPMIPEKTIRLVRDEDDVDVDMDVDAEEEEEARSKKRRVDDV